MSCFPTLFSEIDLGPVQLPNRIMMGSMHLGLEEAPGGFERMAEFYAERARRGVALIVTGGIAPNWEGRHAEDGARMSTADDVARHRLITDAVHGARGKIVMQILHFGRYAKHQDLVGPSALRAPINDYTPRELSGDDVWETVQDYVQAAELARAAGYDGVEIMGSEGYLINSFLAPCTNTRTDEWGGSLENRSRLPVEIVRQTRARIGDDFLLSYRISALDLVPDGSTLEETLALARLIQNAGANLLNTGIGWHESRVPTIATPVPRAAFAEVTARIAEVVTIPVVASNRISTPEVAEDILRRGQASMVSLARPLLADAGWVEKARSGRGDRINTCIGCNQACIDHTLSDQITTCLVNPRAAHETLLRINPTRPRRIAVVGAGPAGMAFASASARRGHDVTVYEAASCIGGQFDVARRIPGKGEFAETLRYFDNELSDSGARVLLNWPVRADELLTGAPYDEIVLATGISPRVPDIPGVDHPTVTGYLDILRGDTVPGDRVVLIGAGGIGFDVAEFLTAPPDSRRDIGTFFETWGVDPTFAARGGLTTPSWQSSPRQVTMLQRKGSKMGADLGVTTGWIHRAQLSRRGVRMLSGVAYERIDDRGVHIRVRGVPTVVAADTVVICAGQEPRRELYHDLVRGGVTPWLIGGANDAAQLDAKRAIRQATELAAHI